MKKGEIECYICPRGHGVIYDDPGDDKIWCSKCRAAYPIRDCRLESNSGSGKEGLSRVHIKESTIIQ